MKPHGNTMGLVCSCLPAAPADYTILITSSPIVLAGVDLF